MKQFIRNFRKQRTVGVLNILGLSLGIMTAIIIGIWSMNEVTFDNFHHNKERIYRTTYKMVANDVTKYYSGNFKPFAEEAIDEIPEIEAMCRVHPYWQEIEVNKTLYQNIKVAMSDPNFFTFFTYPLKEGDPKTCLATEGDVVIDETTAILYFGKQDPIGQILSVDGKEFKISGIMYDMPHNSSLQVNIIFPFFGFTKTDTWGGSDMYKSYFLFKEQADLEDIKDKIQTIYNRNMTTIVNLGFKLYLENIEDIHFSNANENGPITKGSKSIVYIFIFTALIILIISCINFANLFVSTSFIRAKSVGLRKTLGASKANLIADFYRETATYVIITIVIGFLLAHFALPTFNNIMHSNVAINYTSPVTYLFLIAVFLFTTLIAGTFPAFYMTKFNVTETLRSKFRGKSVSIFQKSLIIIQFTASITLLIIIFFFNKQVNFMMNQDLGFNKENIIHVWGRDDLGRNYEAVRNELLQDPSIVDVTMKNSLPTNWVQGWSMRSLENDASNGEILVEMCRVMPNYFDLMQMEMVDGENPLHLADADSMKCCVINETAARRLGISDNPIGRLITPDTGSDNVTARKIQVKGVIKDAQTRSFHTKVDAQVYIKLTWTRGNIYLIKINGNPKSALNTIETKWKELVPNAPFEYQFLDQDYQKLYSIENNASRILTYAMAISFLITIIGLFAMAYYSTQRRLKEIGIRKVNGATIKSLQMLLNKDFIYWVLIAFIISCPIAYFFIDNWLDQFIIRTGLSIWVFVGAGIISCIVALLTVSYQTWRAATINPVDIIKSE